MIKKPQKNQAQSYSEDNIQAHIGLEGTDIHFRYTII